MFAQWYPSRVSPLFNKSEERFPFLCIQFGEADALSEAEGPALQSYLASTVIDCFKIWESCRWLTANKWISQQIAKNRPLDPVLLTVFGSSCSIGTSLLQHIKNTLKTNNSTRVYFPNTLLYVGANKLIAGVFGSCEKWIFYSFLQSALCS